MTLTGIGGSLGIGNTQPTKELDVTGAGNFSGDVTVGNNLTVGGALLGNVQGTLTGNVSGTLQGNSNTTVCLLYTSPSPRDRQKSRMPSSA